MPLFTLDAIRENPWNAIYQDLPEEADALLLFVAFRAASYCVSSENHLMFAAHQGHYIPADYEQGPRCADAHEEIEARWFDADCRLRDIVELYGRRFGVPMTA